MRIGSSTGVDVSGAGACCDSGDVWTGVGSIGVDSTGGGSTGSGSTTGDGTTGFSKRINH